MLKLFGTTDTLFGSNGDKILIPTYQHIIKQDNGEFYLDVELSLNYIDDITPNRILVSNTPTGQQAFRITNVEHRKHKIKVKAKHVFYDNKRQWNQMVDRGISKDFSWNASKYRYEGLYRYLLGE